MDIYLEPVLPPPRLVVFGTSPAAQALARLAKILGFSVDAADPGADAAAFPDADRVFTDLAKVAAPAPAQAPFALVATMGQNDEDAILAALRLEPAYLGVVASRKRFAQIGEVLAARGIGADAQKRIRNPAGLDIGARTPEEVALSILAEVVQVRRAAASDIAKAPPEPAAPEARDPICGMTVAVATARHRAEHRGRTYYFCCGGCRERFLAEPDRYAGGAG